MNLPADTADLCVACDDLIEEPRRLVGLTSCWRCGPVDPASPPWDIEPAAALVWAGYDPGVEYQ